MLPCSGRILWCTIFVVSCCACFCTCAQRNVTTDVDETGRELVEQGRTFVHHVFKRFMVILPAIFFKLGIAFTLLVVVTLVAVNNGFIGFLILVVGLSSVLARFQQAQHPPPIQVPYPVIGHHPFVDRSDVGPTFRKSGRRSDAEYYPKGTHESYRQRTMKDDDALDASLYAAQVARLNDLILQSRYAQNTRNFGTTQAVYGRYAAGA